MTRAQQIGKAETFLRLHHSPKLLILPNIWDSLGAYLLQHLGFPAVATASAAVAYSRGHDDGEKIGFAKMCGVIRDIASSVSIPVTADIERGYAADPGDIAGNVRDVIRAGAVGINIEDSTIEGGPLSPVDFQCDRIRAVRAAADDTGVPLVINARIDVFMSNSMGSAAANLKETIARAKAYRDAGADCIYPITVGDLESLKAIRDAIDTPINVYAAKNTAPMEDLEAAGISRLSLGPGLLKTALTAMRDVARNLQDYGAYDGFTEGVMSSEEIVQIISPRDTEE